MSTQATTHPITVEQYEEFDGYPGLRDELIYGRIVMNPQPKVPHQHVRKNIEVLLSEASKGTAYTVNGDTNIKFSRLNSMPAPDVLVIAKEAWKRAFDTNQYLDTAPLLAVEVLSESNREPQIRQKIDIYLKSGVATVWIVDPARKTVVCHTPGSDDERGSTVPLPSPLRHPMFGDELPLASIFALPE